jgi:asparagine synthase (glutamine-hydrolysing)
MCEKALLRCAIQKHAPGLLPTSVLWRRKEAFSDGVSGEKSWFEVIKDALEGYHMRSMGLSCVNPPSTAEQQFYRDIYDNAYPYAPSPIPAFWMPRFVEANDASARTLDVYN